MSICPMCNQRVTNHADKTKRNSIWTHKNCGLPKRPRKSKRTILSTTFPERESPMKKMYRILMERGGLWKTPVE